MLGTQSMPQNLPMLFLGGSSMLRGSQLQLAYELLFDVAHD